MITIIAAVASAFITGALALVGVIISNNKANAVVQEKIKTGQAVTDTKLEELTREVREHNNFAKRMPVVENEIKSLRRDVADLQEYHKQPK